MSSRVKLILFSLFIILVSILMIGTGLYFNQLSKSSHIMGVVVDQLEEGFFHYLYPHDDLFIGDEFTIDGNVQFDLDSEYYKTTSEDEKEKEIAHEIKNFDQLGNHFLVKQKAKEKQAFLEFEASIGEEKLIGEKILVQNATEYYYISDIVKNYVNNGTCNYFENINEEVSTKDNVDQLAHFLFEAMRRSFKEEYFDRYEKEEMIAGKSEKVTMVAIRLDDKRIRTILNDMIKEFQEDEEIKPILTNLYPDYQKWKISKDQEFLEKDESYTLSVYTNQFFYQPLKIELVHIHGEEKERWVYEGSKNKGDLYYSKNDQLTYQMSCSFQDHSFIIQIQDALGNNIGEVKADRDGMNQTINYSFEDSHKKQDFIYSSKVTDWKKKKAFKNTQKISFKFTEDKINRFSGDIVLEMNAENIAKIEEDISMATLASRLEDAEKEKIETKWDTIKSRMKQ